MNLEEYRAAYSEDTAPGWDAIDQKLAEVYGIQDHRHWAPAVRHVLGGPDPLDGISVYRCAEGDGGHLHYVTFGFSSLYYDEAAVNGPFSGLGFELTIRVLERDAPSDQPGWVCSLLQNLAKYIFKSNKWFEANQWLDARGPIRQNCDTDIVGMIFVPDPVLKTIETPHGRLEFLQIAGITTPELALIRDGVQTPAAMVEELRRSSPLLITDLLRRN